MVENILVTDKPGINIIINNKNHKKLGKMKDYYCFITGYRAEA